MGSVLGGVYGRLFSPTLRADCASKHSDAGKIPKRVGAKPFSEMSEMGLPASSAALDPLEMSRALGAEANIYHTHQFSVQ